MNNSINSKQFNDLFGKKRKSHVKEIYDKRYKVKFKGEEILQLKVVDYISQKYPYVLFSGNPTANVKVSEYLSKKMKALGNTKSWPDIQIAQSASVEVFHSIDGKLESKSFRSSDLYLELKTTQGDPFLKKSEGLKKATHIENQALLMGNLISRGKIALFSVGDMMTFKIIDSYLKGQLKVYMYETKLNGQRCIYLKPIFNG